MPKQDVSVELYYDGSWHDIAAADDVYAESPIVIQRGQGDESPAPRPAQLSMRLANDDDRYRTSNPESPLYGRAGRNTPARVSVGGVVRGVVEASSWGCDQTSDFRADPPRGKAWTDVEGGGILQRIGQWTEPLKSPFREFNDRITESVGYWHCEQAKGSTTLDSTVPGVAPPQSWERNFYGVAFDSQHRPPGSAPLMDVAEPAQVALNFAATGARDSTAGWQFSWAARYGDPEGTDRYLMYVYTLSDVQYLVKLAPTEGKLYFYVGIPGFSYVSLGEASKSYGSYDFTQWTLFNIGTSHSAGTTTAWLEWTNGDNTASDILVVNFSGVTSALRAWFFLGAAGEVPDGSTVGHFLGVNVDLFTVDLFSADRIYAWTGYLGELAAERFGRLCGQLDVPYYVSTSWAASQPMGPQPVASLSEQIEEITTTEDALLFDLKTELRLYLLCRADRYNRTPAVELTPEDLPALPREVTDDQGVHNIVTMVQRDGADATSRDDTGPLGTLPPPDGAGEYRQRIDVNVEDPFTTLPALAGWWRNRGTVDLPRFPQVKINLNALAPARVAQIEAVDVGDVITITGFREYTVRLYVLGYTEVIGTHTREITFVCAPDRQFDVGKYNNGRRYGSASTTLAADLTTTEQVWSIRTVNEGDVWSTTAGYDVIVGGEVCTTTNVTAAVLSGGYWTQTMTCTRSVNGIVKTHSTGDRVTIAPAAQARYAL